MTSFINWECRHLHNIEARIMSFVHDRTESFIHYYTNLKPLLFMTLTFDNITTWKLKEQGWTLLKHYWHSGVHRLASWIPRLWTRGPGARHKPRKLSLSSSHQDPAEIKNELHLELKAVESEHKLRMRIFGILHNPCWPQKTLVYSSKLQKMHI